MTTELQRRIAENKQTQATDLNLENLDITGFEPELLELADFKWLEDLDLSNNRITDISFLKPLFDLKDLGYVFLNNNLIEDLTPLSSYKDNSEDGEYRDYPYWSLYLNNNRIKDLSPLKGKAFSTFSVENNLIDTITLDVPYADDHFRFAGNPVLERMSNLLGSRIGEGVWVAIRLQTIDQIPDDIYPYDEVRECLEILKQRGEL
ncbi:MAG: leucine-rich repeat domain-containing protein [Candidatus Kapabacteria bacterium]|jgi:Leucine-rich repeat (LRR) protein|nr:leucine-rich repeat domain-containing protein [Candidatus Kapabacteria bacterium]